MNERRIAWLNLYCRMPTDRFPMSLSDIRKPVTFWSVCLQVIETKESVFKNWMQIHMWILEREKLKNSIIMNLVLMT